MTSTTQTFKHFRQFNGQQPPTWLGSHSSLTASDAARHFPGDSLQNKLVRQLGSQRLLPIKEMLECGELFERVRHKLRSPIVADLCSGHGLLGILFAIFERRVERVLLIDRRRPASYLKLIDCAVRVAPWIETKVTFREQRIDRAGLSLPEGTSIVSAHACGSLTDRCLDLAIAARGAVAVMPCCYPKRACPAPRSLQKALGLATAFDIARTYRLEAAGYTTHWATIPAVITPMHRILVARPGNTGASPSKNDDHGIPEGRQLSKTM